KRGGLTQVQTPRVEAAKGASDGRPPSPRLFSFAAFASSLSLSLSLPHLGFRFALCSPGGAPGCGVMMSTIIAIMSLSRSISCSLCRNLMGGFDFCSLVCFVVRLVRLTVH
ncbi:unnamed protein product, partial [Musa acuminata subsp. burmannicoides]